MKARAPPPPGKPSIAPNIHSDQKPNRDLGTIPQQNLVNMKENLRSSMVDVTVVLPNGLEIKSTINGSNAMMDLLVELCLQNHLNPAHYTLELRSLETQQPLSFKPNTLIGTLDVHTIFLKEKVPEEKSKPVLHKVPEKSVRLVVNYLRTQKTVVRVSPDVPLQNILPVICAKCEVSPEHIVLLRDNIAGEELELSKSLNELGIKELYAWDNKRETYRKSLGSDVMDKEKKKFLGFFKVSKRSNKAEQHGVLRVDSDEDILESTTENFNGCLTTPNSPSVNSRSLTLGPSLSLSNISGVSSDIKKRRAPPPPSVTPSVTPSATPSLPSTEAIGQDKMSEKVSQASQNELQKKKRRAPAPPPPPPPPSTPLIPNRTDKEENRKSTMGVGRQVPQKPPRGSPRGPPQLVLPPPPPYPPPDTDIVDSPGFHSEADGTESSELGPKLSLPLIHSSNCSVDGVITELSEVEETASVSSCFASEDTTTEDSGVMSSPSDIVSLDSRNDSVKSKDKWALDQEDAPDMHVTCAAKLGPPRSASRESDDSGITHLRNENAITAKDDDDIFINGQLQKTIAEFDEDLEELEENYETDTNSLTDSTNGVPSSHGQEVIVPKDNAYTIPVTFIGEVLDDPVDLGTFINKNNNAGSFDMEHMANKTTYITESPMYDQSCKAKANHLLVKKRENIFESYVSSCEMNKEKDLAASNNCRNISPHELKPRVSSSTPKTQIGDVYLKESNNQGHESNGIQRSHVTKKMISEMMMEKQTSDTNDLIVPSSWYYRGQNPIGPKAGLTTYKIVPPKSEMKCYDRGVSLSTGAIKIDELGNLVNPHVNGKKSTLIPSVSETETLPIGKVKEFWRSNSIERHPDGPIDCAKRASATLPLKQHHKETKLKAEPEFLDPKLKLSQPAAHKVGGNNSELDKSKPPTTSVTSTAQAKVPVATLAHPTGEILPFLKPQRRTSSQYVASAIARRMETPSVNTRSFSKSKREQSGWENRKLRQDLAPPPEKENLLNSAHPITKASKNDPKRSYSDCWVDHGKESIKPSSGASSEMENRGANIKPLTQDSSADSYKQSINEPLTKSSPNTDYFVKEVRGYNGKHSNSHQKTSSVCDPKCKADNANSSLPARSPGFQTSSGSASSATKWPCVSNNDQNAAGVNNQGVLKREDRSDALPAHDSEFESPLQATVFGPKKKFKPVVQKPAPKDTSLHSALMEAIQTAGGKEKLRKTAEHSPEGSLKKPSYTEPESERSALLAAIRGHSGASSLKKVSSSASGELKSLRETAFSQRTVEGLPQENEPHIPPPPVAPPLAPHISRASTVSKMTLRFPTGPTSDPADARQALMDAIRSGTGAARLKKVPLLV
ncbi:protein cordon-bleu isoform X3 [Vombatus ursinus]|nr:protein cordon-bleu isoform X3 [Vombatus ursinus]XP_027692927.1 protein cordon-bleu isoform X3 [Vombatus ursinus]